MKYTISPSQKYTIIVNFTQHAWVTRITVTAVWNTGETGDMYLQYNIIVNGFTLEDPISSPKYLDSLF